mgnify:FL=1
MYVTLSIPKTPNSDFNTAQIVTTCTVGITQHALKGQKLLAQGSALGYYVRKLVAL